MRGKVPENLVLIPQGGYRPKFNLRGMENPKLDSAYFSFLFASYLPSSIRYIKLSSNQACGIPKVPLIGEFYPCGFDPVLVQMTEPQREAASKLWCEIYSALREAYQAGLDHGRNLMVQLANGEITNSDFEAR